MRTKLSVNRGIFLLTKKEAANELTAVGGLRDESASFLPGLSTSMIGKKARPRERRFRFRVSPRGSHLPRNPGSSSTISAAASFSDAISRVVVAVHGGFA